jgi:tRNA pseudouridine38-40 synthase
MPSRLKLIVAYDGRPFAGWQSQANGNAIQDHLETAFERICSKRIRVHGAGRTDAGVHALGQCAHVDLPARRYGTDRWVAALNGVLPPAIRIMSCEFVSAAFHARFSAKGKVYRYRIWNADVLPPLEEGRAWHVRNPMDIAVLTNAAKDFLGKHDFASFAANRGSPVSDTIRTIRRISIRRSGPRIAVELEGHGFLYKMVRLMVGALVQISLGAAASEEIRLRLEAPRHLNSRARNAAPGAGLFLLRVRY